MFSLPYERNQSAEEIKATYQRLFASPDGKVVLNHLLGELCHLSMPCDDVNDLGRQAVGYKILNLIKED